MAGLLAHGRESPQGQRRAGRGQRADRANQPLVVPVLVVVPVALVSPVSAEPVDPVVSVVSDEAPPVEDDPVASVPLDSDPPVAAVDVSVCDVVVGRPVVGNPLVMPILHSPRCACTSLPSLWQQPSAWHAYPDGQADAPSGSQLNCTAALGGVKHAAASPNTAAPVHVAAIEALTFKSAPRSPWASTASDGHAGHATFVDSRRRQTGSRR